MYVNPTEHRYLEDIEHREEGGTLAIVESIRAGLVFQLKDAVGVERIRCLERSFIDRRIESWDANPRTEILGNRDAERLSIVSVVVKHRDQHLHHNFVVALLNDLFGIQSRGGCSCAGPYGHRLLGIDLERSHEFEREISRGCEGIKPGWLRLSFNYFIGEAVFQYILDAVHLVANEGWRLLPSYRFDLATASSEHRDGRGIPPLSLEDIDYADGTMRYEHRPQRDSDTVLAGYLDEARRLLSEAPLTPPLGEALKVTEDFEQLRWVPLRHEASADPIA